MFYSLVSYQVEPSPLQSGQSLAVPPSDGAWPVPWQKEQCLASFGIRLKPFPMHTGQGFCLESIPWGSGNVPLPLQTGQRFSIIIVILLGRGSSYLATIVTIIQYSTPFYITGKRLIVSELWNNLNNSLILACYYLGRRKGGRTQKCGKLRNSLSLPW